VTIQLMVVNTQQPEFPTNALSHNVDSAAPTLSCSELLAGRAIQSLVDHDNQTPAAPMGPEALA
jgi:hypothetical protein